jgi:hypothetical protein
MFLFAALDAGWVPATDGKTIGTLLENGFGWTVLPLFRIRAFVAGGYGRDRGRRIAPPGATGQPVLHFERSS